MALNYKAMRLAYRYIKRIDSWMGNRLDEGNHIMIIRKTDRIYHIDIYNKDILVDTQYALDDRHINDKLIGSMLDMMFTLACILVGWIIGTRLGNIIVWSDTEKQ